MKPSDVLASTSKFSLTFQQNQIFLRLLELDFETDLAFALIKSYPEDLSFPDFLNRFISDENSILNHVFIPSNPNIFLCIICDQPESQHAKVPIEEEEKISKIYKEMTEPNKEEKSQISNVINTSIYKSKIRTTCKICFESKQEQFLFKLNFINHEICIDCLKKYITSEIIKGKLFPLKCPHCQIANLDLNIIKQFVDQTTFLKYQRLVIGYMIASNKEFLYCPGYF